MESTRVSWAALALLLTMLALQVCIHPIPLTVSATTHHQQQQGGDQHLHNMVFYMHDLTTTAVPVAAQNGSLGPPFKLGITQVFDDKITEGPDFNSAEIGRGQGVYTLASLTNPDLFFIFTAVLHQPASFNGSTICFHGSDRTALPEREISVVGGTGVFRFARGYAILSTVALDGLNAIIKFNITMLL